MAQINNNNNQDDNFELLFFKVWKNKYIVRYIFREVRIYKRNETVEFNFIESLLEYKERLYIQKLVYKGRDPLKIGDLPNNGVLNTLAVTFDPILNGNVIPIGVENVLYDSYLFSNITTKLSELPISVTNVENVKLSNDDIFDINCIPSNIKSIQFKEYSNVYIPNTITSLKFDRFGNVDGCKLYNDYFKNTLKIFHLYGEFGLKVGLLPSSITDLAISLNGIEEHSIFENGLLPINLKSLTINAHGSNLNITDISLPSSLKNLSLLLIGSNSIFSLNSLPLGLTSLTIDKFSKFEGKSLAGAIKTSACKLNFLQLNAHFQYEFKELSQSLPLSLKKLVLPEHLLKYFNNIRDTVNIECLKNK